MRSHLFLIENLNLIKCCWKIFLLKVFWLLSPFRCGVKCIVKIRYETDLPIITYEINNKLKIILLFL